MSGWLWQDRGDADEQAARIDQIRAGTAAREQETEARDVQLARERKLDVPGGVTDKDVQRRGLELDVHNTNLEFEKSLAANKQGIITSELLQKSLDDQQRLTASIYSAFKSGHTEAALKALNQAHHLHPGEEFASMELKDSGQQDTAGNPVKALVLTPKDKAKAPSMYPVSQLDALVQKYGSTYEKVGNNYVRRNTDGTVTPLYESEQYVPDENAPGGAISKRTGLPPPQIIPLNNPPQPQPQPAAPPPQARVPGATAIPGSTPGASLIRPGDTAPTMAQAAPAAAVGVSPAAVQAPAAAPAAAQYGAVMPGGRVLPYAQSRKATTAAEATTAHLDKRVNDGTAVVNKYFGISEFTGLEPKNQPRYISIVNRMAGLIRGGADPQVAANTAIAEQVRADKLGQPPGSQTGAYTGPAPWRQ